MIYRNVTHAQNKELSEIKEIVEKMRIAQKELVEQVKEERKVEDDRWTKLWHFLKRFSATSWCDR